MRIMEWLKTHTGEGSATSVLGETNNNFWKDLRMFIFRKPLAGYLRASFLACLRQMN
jgi:hypothetical protein